MKITTYENQNDFLNVLETKFPKPWINDLMIGLVTILIKNPEHFDTNPDLFTLNQDDKVILTSFLTNPWLIILYAEELPDENVMSYFIDFINNIFRWYSKGLIFFKR